MISRKDRKPSSVVLPGKQRGGALILIAFMLGIALTAFMIKNFSANSIKLNQDAKTMEALGQAEEGLIAWSASHPAWPGVMPFPDRGTDAGGYDGVSDCVTSGVTTTHLLGMLPLLSGNPCFTPQTELGIVPRDGSGERLWYAVSRNLIRTNGTASTPVINPGIIDNPTTAPWMIVRDSAGVVISNRVAAVIIAPGPALSGQNRSGNDAPPSNYLDQTTLGATTYSNADFDEDFIIGDTTTGTFNDRLVYITIDELMAALERRVAAEARDALRKYQASIGRFPYAVPLGSSASYSCVEGTAAGLLPLDSNPSTSCSCTSSQNCTCAFDEIDTVSFSQSGPAWAGSSGSCTASGNTCTCSGTGQCDDLLGLIIFACDGITGNCTSNFPGSFTFEGAFENTNVNAVTGACTHSCGSTTVSCNGAGTFSSGSCGDPGISPTIKVSTIAGTRQLTTTSNFITQGVIPGMIVSGTGIPTGATVSSVTNSTRLMISQNTTVTDIDNVVTFSRLPTWFEANSWQDYLYYGVSRDAAPTMTIGSRIGVQAMLATPGRAINTTPFAEGKGAAQTRISCNVEDYLDSNENVNANSVYEATNKSRSLNYNDQLFIVAP